VVDEDAGFGDIDTSGSNGEYAVGGFGGDEDIQEEV